MPLWPGMSRREENHMKNESPTFTRQKAREAQRQAIEKDRAAKKAKDPGTPRGRQRNNRREY